MPTSLLTVERVIPVDSSVAVISTWVTLAPVSSSTFPWMPVYSCASMGVQDSVRARTTANPATVRKRCISGYLLKLTFATN